MSNRKNPLIMFYLGFVSLFLSCVQEGITEEMLSEVHDDVAPVFSDVVPGDGFAYGAYTQIAGTVTDQDNSGERGLVESLTLEIVDITEPVSITVNEDGSFSSEILTTFGSSYSSSITVKLTAIDWNGNSTIENLNYSKADGEITNFTITRGNKKVSMSWDGLGDGNYVYYVKELFYGLGEITVESNEDTVTTEWPQPDMADLDNGKNYTFYVYTTAADEEETTLTSPMISTMPLSPLSCTPIVHANLHSNDLLWPELTDADKYVIQRADTPDGTWETIGITTKNYLKDSNPLGCANYYRIYPYSTESPVEEEIIDELATGMVDDTMYSQMGDFTEAVTTYTGTGFKSIAIEDNYAYICKDSSITVLDINIQDSTPITAGSYTAPSGVTIMDLSIKGDYGFLSCIGTNSTDPDLILLDLSDPTAPTATGQLALATSDTTPIEFFAIRSFLYGPYLYILMDKTSDTYEGLFADSIGTYSPSWGIVDVSDMTEPVFLGRNITFSDSADMVFFRHYASNKNIAVLNADNNYSGMTGGYICYFELTDPLVLLSSSFDYTGIMDPMTYKGRLAFGENSVHISKFSGGETQLGVYDFSLTTPNGSTGYETSGLYLDVFYGQVATYHNLIPLGSYGVYNTTNGIGKYTLTDMEHGSAFNDLSCTAYDIEVNGEYAYLITSTGLKVFKINWST